MFNSKKINNFNESITICRTDIEKIKNRFEYRVGELEDYLEYSEMERDNYYEGFEEGMERDEDLEAQFARIDIIVENLEEAVSLKNKAAMMLEDENFMEMSVDADEWFDMWNVEGGIEDGETDDYFMIPYSAEMNEMLKKSVFGRQSPRFSIKWDFSKAREDCYA
jgi:hypothetical protein